jgi:tyrosine decarboxylase / aspartate 1-decarboxylase
MINSFKTNKISNQQVEVTSIMKINDQLIEILRKTSNHLLEAFYELPESEMEIDCDELLRVTMEVAKRMRDNYPYHHPFYCGQMLKPPHPVAWIAYRLAMILNPNNHALDGGIASSKMEKEAVHEIAKMVGWENYLGHLTSGGTVANLEGLWISKMLNPGKKIVASSQAHYTHERLSKVLSIPFESVPCDSFGKMKIDELREILDQNDVGTVVSTIGTTGTGSVDPLNAIFELKSEYGFRIHADAAYGGYFKLAGNLDVETKKSIDLLSEVDSIVIDPHKHGLQPYGCGCILFKDPTVGQFYKHDSPYTYFTSSELHLGEISLECSRPGASAVALWATQQLMPYTKNGIFAKNLEKSREAAILLYDKLNADKRFITAMKPELDIIIFAPKADNSGDISRLSNEFFDITASKNIHLAKANMPSIFFKRRYPEISWFHDHITCLRSCLMKPEHLDWIDKIWEIIDDVSSILNEKII